ncbi:uncharacterized protein DS421_3g68420 [Arachis hypogaea]|nr:uncharacterized protein DS421_3g68420 [Arachis hypogaea]
MPKSPALHHYLACLLFSIFIIQSFFIMLHYLCWLRNPSTTSTVLEFAFILGMHSFFSSAPLSLLYEELLLTSAFL